MLFRAIFHRFSLSIETISKRLMSSTCQLPDILPSNVVSETALMTDNMTSDLVKDCPVTAALSCEGNVLLHNTARNSLPTKRDASELKDEEGLSSEKEPKKPKSDTNSSNTIPTTNESSSSSVKGDDRACMKRKMAMLLVYSGKGYLGMQINPGYKTIEGDLLNAFVKAGIVRPDHIEKPGTKMGYQRAARTDKGVSAAGQVVSLKMFVDVENAVEKINSHLPNQIRVLGVKRTTKGFDSKNGCNSRTYIYISPTFAFAPLEELVKEDYRISDDVLNRVQETINLYKGTHNFHNFTSGKKPNDPSAKRYIMDFKVGRPFERDGLEYIVLTVHGQSFMLHMIRKMIGLMMAVVRGLTGVEAINSSWKPDKYDVPKAPGLGLVLDTLHYDAYNKKWGHDGVHDPIAWDEYKDEIERFKEEYIYPTIFATEKEEKSMLKWLATLPLHHYEVKQDAGRTPSPLMQAAMLINNPTDHQATMPVNNPTEQQATMPVNNPTDQTTPNGEPIPSAVLTS